MIIIHCDWILFLKDSFFLLFYMTFFNPLLRLVKSQPKATENRGSEVELSCIGPISCNNPLVKDRIVTAIF